MNTWMNNPQYLAQAAHTLGGALVVVLVCVFFGWDAWKAAGILLTLYATVKEFWYDLKYELPKQTWGDSLMDFAFYELGGAIGVLVMLGAHHLGRV